MVENVNPNFYTLLVKKESEITFKGVRVSGPKVGEGSKDFWGWY